MNQIKMSRIGALSMIIILAFVLSGCGNKAESYYKSAVKQYSKGEFEAASENFTKAIELKDDHADYYIDYGFCLLELQQYSKANEVFQKAIMDKDNIIANKNNKKAYRGLGITAYLMGDYEAAITQLTKALKYDSLNDYDMDIVTYIGSANLQLGNYEQAVENFTEVLEHEKKNITALLGRGQANCRLGKYEESIADYNTAKAIDNKNYSTYFGLYDAYTKQGDATNATTVLEEASSIKIDDEKDKFYLAMIHYYQGNLEQSLEEFESASKSGIAESSYYLGEIHYAEKDYESAIYYFEQYETQVTSPNVSFYNKLAECYLHQGEYSKALAIIEKGRNIASGSELKSMLRNEIIVYEHLGEFEESYKRMEEYLNLYPEDEEAKREMEFIKTRQQKAVEENETTDVSDEIVKP